MNEELKVIAVLLNEQEVVRVDEHVSHLHHRIHTNVARNQLEGSTHPQLVVNLNHGVELPIFYKALFRHEWVHFKKLISLWAVVCQLENKVP